MNRKRLFAAVPRMAVALVVAVAALMAPSGPAAATPQTALGWSWGANADGQLGDGTTVSRPFAGAVPGMAGVVEVAAGPSHTLALDSSGRIWAWGANTYGQLGDGSTRSRSAPAAVPRLSGAVAVAAGSHHSLALLADGTVRAWGYNADGRLGDGTTVHRHEPVRVAGLDHVVALASRAMESFAVRDDGTVWVWGRMAWMPPVDGAPNPYVPSVIPQLGDVTDVAAGEHHALALRSDGSVSAWGLNHHGQLGDGTLEHRGYPVAITGLTDVATIAAGAQHSLAVRRDGSVWAWGRNSDGQLGDAGTDHRSRPAAVPGLSGVDAVSAGAAHSLAVTGDGRAWGWGRNADGQLGDGTTEDRPTPTPVVDLREVSAVTAGASHSVALRSGSPVEPGVPTEVAATATDGSAVATWRPPPDGGSPLTGYTVVVSPGGATRTVASDSTSVEFTGLTNGTRYRFAVRAHNAVGASRWSPLSEPAVYATVPGAPANVSASVSCTVCNPPWHPNGATVTVSWAAASDGGAAIVGYRITRQPGGVTTSVGDVRSWSVRGLEYGVSYTFTVTAVNAVGDGPASDPSPAVTPRAAPAAPSGVRATPGNGQAQMTWTAPPDGGSPITSYTVYVTPGWRSVSVDGTSTSATIDGLTNGTAYAFTVLAANRLGHSPESALSNWVTPAHPVTVPGAPTNVRAAAGVRAATVSWDAPASDGHSAITGYTIVASPGGRTAAASPAAREVTMTGLRVGTAYTFTVTASNDRGAGVASAASNSVRPIPPAVTDLSRTARFDRLTDATPRPRVALAWKNRGTPDAIRVRWTDGARAHAATLTPAPSTYTVKGLPYGRAVTFTVRAITNGMLSAPARVSAHGSAIDAVARTRSGTTIVSGHLTRAGTADPLARRGVRLQMRTQAAGGSPSEWANVASPVHTTTAGRYEISYPLPSGAQYRVVFAGGGATLGTVSRVQTRP